MLLLTGLLAGSALAAAAVPPAPVPQAQQVVQTSAPWLAAAPLAPAVPATPAAETSTALDGIFAPPQQNCPLCIQGYHCCFFGPNPRCVPQTQQCP
jgi:hypothetical protein